MIIHDGRRAVRHWTIVIAGRRLVFQVPDNPPK